MAHSTKNERLLLAFRAVFARKFVSWIYRGHYTLRRRRSIFLRLTAWARVWACVCILLTRSARIFGNLLFWWFWSEFFLRFICFCSFFLLLLFVRSSIRHRTEEHEINAHYSLRACIINFDSTLGRAESLGEFDGWWARDTGCYGTHSSREFSISGASSWAVKSSKTFGRTIALNFISISETFVTHLNRQIKMYKIYCDHKT